MLNTLQNYYEKFLISMMIYVKDATLRFTKMLAEFPDYFLQRK